MSDFLSGLRDALPEDLRRFHEEARRNCKAAFGASLERLDLVTRREYDIQLRVLDRLRTRTGDLEQRVAELESKLEQKNGA